MPSGIGWTHKNNSARRPFIEHTLAIADFATSLFAATDVQSEIALNDMDTVAANLPKQRRERTQPFAWRVSLIHIGQRHTLGLAPDYAFSLKRGEQRRPHFYLAECDRGTMPVRRYGNDPFCRTSIFKKLMAYQSGWRQNYHAREFDWPNFRVLFITSTQARSEHMQECLAEMTHGKGSPLFWFTDRNSLEQSLVADDILNLRWIDGRGREQSLDG